MAEEYYKTASPCLLRTRSRGSGGRFHKPVQVYTPGRLAPSEGSDGFKEECKMKSTEMQPVINIDNGLHAFLKYSGEKLHLAMRSSHHCDVINRGGVGGGPVCLLCELQRVVRPAAGNM